jgi:hypothetical protein
MSFLKKISLIVIMFLAVTLYLPNNSFAKKNSEFKYWIKNFDGSHYQQKDFKKVDPKGDAILMRKIDQVPLKLIKAILKIDDYHQNEDRKENQKSKMMGFSSKLKNKVSEKLKLSKLDSMIKSMENEETSFDRMNQKDEIYNLNVLIKNEENLLQGKNKTNKLFNMKNMSNLVSKNKEFKIGKKHPFNVDRLINAIRKVIIEHPEIKLTMSEEHKWSKEARRYMVYGFWHRIGRFITRRQKDIPSPLFMRSKFFLLLACGYTSRYAITGFEDKLESKLLSYPDRSLNIHKVFEESYILHNGDIYLTMLCIENILARNPYVKDRQKLPIQKKLVYLRNDSDKTGDNYGAWYHLFGIATYGILRPGLVSRSVAEIESLGSIFLEGFDSQEDYINRLGSIFGLKLRRMIKKKTYLKPLLPNESTDYMTNVEFKN